MVTALRPRLLAILLLCDVTRMAAQTIPPPDDSRNSLLREAVLGLTPSQPGVPARRAMNECLELPVAPPDDRLEGPHGDSMVTARCQVVAFRALERGTQPHWTTARYAWTSVFSAEDTTRGAGARDTVTEEEVVLFDAAELGKSRPVWHARFETGNYAMWRSITPELARARGGVLLSIMRCFNGTGGCGQEFLLRHPDGRWFPVWQVWPEQLPQGFVPRLLHGFHIDPRTLRGEAGFYGERNGNCCPSQILVVHLALRGDSLVLQRHAVRPAPNE
jgi:hypothetical protein